MQFLQYDFRWKSPESVEFQASLDERFGKKIITIGAPLSLEIMSEVQCAGSIINEIWQPCPDKNKEKSKCDICKAREKKDNFVFTVFDGFNQEHLQPEDFEKIAGIHYVYLALFNRDTIKVGVSKQERKILRQIEQGAYATLFVAETPDGTIARQIETTLRKTGIYDKIQASQKILYDPLLSPEESQTLLMNFWEKAKTSIKLSYKKYILQKPLFEIWENVYQLPILRKNTKPIHAINLQKGEWISGNVIAWKGGILFLETPEEIILLQAKEYNGRIIEFNNRPAGIGLLTAVQNSLF